MTAKNSQKLDIAQRIAECLSRTSEPKASASGFKKKDGDKVIGSVPVHLRHLHNLLAELGKESAKAELEFHSRKDRMMMVRSIFFDALKTQVPGPEDCGGLTLLENWDVVANPCSESEMGLAELLAAVTGSRR